MPSSGIVIPNTFATQSGNVAASTLDTNFSALASQANALSSAGNYFVDNGAANAISVNIPAPLTASYAAGLPLQIKVAATNTGATTINVNGLGAIPLIYPSGAALSVGQISSGGLIFVMYDGANFQLLSSPSSTSTTGNFTATLTGVLGTVTGTVYYVISGNICTLYSKTGIGGTSNSSTLGLSGLPSIVQPNYTAQALCSAYQIIAAAPQSLSCLASLPAASSSLTFAYAVLSGSSIIYSSSWSGSSTVGLTGGWQITYPLS